MVNNYNINTQQKRRVIQQRDIDIIRAVLRYRALSTDQIEALLFNEWIDAEGVTHIRNGERYSSQCRTRLAELYKRGHLYRAYRDQPINEGRLPIVYELDENGRDYLAFQDGVDPKSIDWKKGYKFVTSFFLDHLFAINDLRLAIELSIRHNPFQLLEWQDDTTLRRAKRIRVTLEVNGQKKLEPLIPDGYGVISADGRSFPLFIEADRGTETLDVFRRKILAYRTLRQNGLFQARFGQESFRVLIATTSDERLANLVKVAEDAGARFTFYFTTHDRIKRGRGSYADPLREPIWRNPGRDGLRAVIPVPQPEQSDATSPRKELHQPSRTEAQGALYRT